MTAQYLRKFSLTIGNADGEAMDLSELQCRFVITQADTQAPSFADIRIYNVSAETSQALQDEYTHVTVQAGYDGNFGVIFRGVVRQYRRGRENATDTFLQVLAQDGDKGYNFAVSNTTLAAGWNQTSLHKELVGAFSTHDIVAGYVPEFGGPKMPRGKVCYGMTRDYMRTLADSAGASWHIADGVLNVLPIGTCLPGEAEVLTFQTGLIGMPQQTLNGVTAKCLINPRIKHGGLVKIDNASVQAAAFNVAFQPGTSNALFTQDGAGADVVKNENLTRTDGQYKVFSITITGDTRGQEWYFDLVCVDINATTPLTGPYVNATASSTGF